jgi:hypothetical protein
LLLRLGKEDPFSTSKQLVWKWSLARESAFPIGLTNLSRWNLRLPYCGSCGKAVPEGMKFCPECGFPQTLPPTAKVLKRPVSARPRSFVMLTLFDILGGVFMMFIGLVSFDTTFTLRKPWIWWPAILQAVVVLLIGIFFTLLTVYTSAILAIYSVPAILLGLWSLYLLRRGEIHSQLRTS